MRAFPSKDEAICMRGKRMGVGYRFCSFPGLYRCRMFRSGARALARLAADAVPGADLQDAGSGRAPPRQLLQNVLLALRHVLLVSVSPYFVAGLALAGLAPPALCALAAAPIVLRQEPHLLRSPVGLRRRQRRTYALAREPPLHGAAARCRPRWVDGRHSLEGAGRIASAGRPRVTLRRTSDGARRRA